MQNTVQWKARHSYVVLAFLLIIIVLVLAGCASFRRAQEEEGTLSAASRMDVTATLDADRSSTTRGAIISAVAGGVTGSIIGRQMDQQVKEIEQRIAGATVERLGEGIEVTFASEPLAARVTDDGGHPNQRVEVAIFASPSYRNELSKQRNTR